MYPTIFYDTVVNENIHILLSYGFYSVVKMDDK